MPRDKSWAAVNSGPPDLFGSVDDYRSALLALEERGLAEKHRAMLLAHLAAPGCTATWLDLADAVGYSSYKTVNLQYGALAHRIASQLGIEEAPLQDLVPGGWWGFVLAGWAPQLGRLDHTAYIMRPPLAAALRALGWSPDSSEHTTHPTAVDVTAPAKRTEATVSRIVRDTAIVRDLKALHKNTCQQCGKRLELGASRFYSEGHHLRPLGKPHDGPDVRSNIVIVCPDCHVLLDFLAVAVEPTRLRSSEAHVLDPEYVSYHNQMVRSQRDNMRWSRQPSYGLLPPLAQLPSAAAQLQRYAPRKSP